MIVLPTIGITIHRRKCSSVTRLKPPTDDDSDGDNGLRCGKVRKRSRPEPPTIRAGILFESRSTQLARAIYHVRCNDGLNGPFGNIDDDCHEGHVSLGLELQ